MYSEKGLAALVRNDVTDLTFVFSMYFKLSSAKGYWENILKKHTSYFTILFRIFPREASGKPPALGSHLELASDTGKPNQTKQHSI